MKFPLDREDRSVLGWLLVLMVLLLLAAAVLGLCVRIFLLLAFGGN